MPSCAHACSSQPSHWPSPHQSWRSKGSGPPSQEERRASGDSSSGRPRKRSSVACPHSLWCSDSQRATWCSRGASSRSGRGQGQGVRAMMGGCPAGSNPWQAPGPPRTRSSSSTQVMSCSIEPATPRCDSCKPAAPVRRTAGHAHLLPRDFVHGVVCEHHGVHVLFTHVAALALALQGCGGGREGMGRSVDGRGRG